MQFVPLSVSCAPPSCNMLFRMDCIRCYRQDLRRNADSLKIIGFLGSLFLSNADQTPDFIQRLLYAGMEVRDTVFGSPLQLVVP